MTKFKCRGSGGNSDVLSIDSIPPSTADGAQRRYIFRTICKGPSDNGIILHKEDLLVLIDTLNELVGGPLTAAVFKAMREHE